MSDISLLNQEISNIIKNNNKESFLKVPNCNVSFYPLVSMFLENSIINNNLDYLEFILNKQLPTEFIGFSPLLIAIQSNNINATNILLKNGFNKEESVNIIIELIDSNNLDIIKLFSEYKYNLSIDDGYILSYCAEHSNLETLKYLFSLKIKFSKNNLKRAILRTKNIEIFDYILDNDVLNFNTFDFESTFIDDDLYFYKFKSLVKKGLFLNCDNDVIDLYKNIPKFGAFLINNAFYILGANYHLSKDISNEILIEKKNPYYKLLKKHNISFKTIQKTKSKNLLF